MYIIHTYVYTQFSDSEQKISNFRNKIKLEKSSHELWTGKVIDEIINNDLE